MGVKGRQTVSLGQDNGSTNFKDVAKCVRNNPSLTRYTLIRK